MTSVSMIMICRDNAETIGAVLDDARAAGCAELCVVDTGSLDDTPHIAKDRGATVHYRTWRNDFAWAKNEALGLASNDWCLILDSDDRISDPAELRRFFENDLPRIPESCHAMVFDVVVGVGEKAFNVTHVRMLRRSSGLHFTYPIHEQVNCDGHDVYYMRDVRILHQREMDATHIIRNINLMLGYYGDAEKWESLTHTARQHMRLYLGREHLGLENKTQARIFFAEYFIHGTQAERNDYWANFFQALATTVGSLRIERFAQTAKLQPERAEAWVELGRCLIERHRYRDAIRALGNAAHCAPPVGMGYSPDYSWRPLLLIAVCADALGEHDKAITFARAAKAKGAPQSMLTQAV